MRVGLEVTESDKVGEVVGDGEALEHEVEPAVELGHSPEHDDAVRPVAFPNVPGGHSCTTDVFVQ